MIITCTYCYWSYLIGSKHNAFCTITVNLGIHTNNGWHKEIVISCQSFKNNCGETKLSQHRIALCLLHWGANFQHIASSADYSEACLRKFSILKLQCVHLKVPCQRCGIKTLGTICSVKFSFRNWLFHFSCKWN